MPPRPMPPGLEEMEAKGDQIREKVRRKIDQVISSGTWCCKDCDSFCDRIEDDHGQPAKCDRCGSHRIHFVKGMEVAK
jgi:uncharacterized paraquat-inducible protein A